MRKFTLIFVLLILTVSFVSVYLYFASDKKTLISKVIDTQTTVENASGYYEDYTKDAYDKAIEEKNVIFLYFTANWCPICREQEPINKQVFEALGEVGVVGLRIHILDSETTEETESLAKKFDVTYQHSYVILDSSGAVNYKHTGPLEEEFLVNKIREAINAPQGEVVD